MKNVITTMLVASFFVALLAATAGAKTVGVKYPDQTPGVNVQRLNAINLQEVIGRGFPVVRDFSSDLSRADLEGIVGRGFITKLTPEEIEQIDAQGFLPSPDELLTMTQSLVQITVKGIRIVIDKSNISEAELIKTVSGWEKFLATL